MDLLVINTNHDGIFSYIILFEQDKYICYIKVVNYLNKYWRKNNGRKENS